MGYDIAALRAAEFPWAGETIYLDHASIVPCPSAPAWRASGSSTAAPGRSN
ncbi:MAG: hypothetical protein SF070_17475 [Gemmatimonadota bacterium]|nr:hypothetical protein [Gemmatimonadota bacterium]